MIDITDGDILVGGQSVRDRDEDELRRDIGYVIQQIGLFPHRTVADNIATVPQLLGWDKRRTAARVDELLDLIGLPARDGPALPGAALRRPAPARRRRPRARRRPAADADGRAVRRDRPDQPRAAAERVPAPAGRDPQDDRLRHPRHRRGDQDGRPDRDPAGGRHPRAVRAARRAADAPGERVRRGLRRRATARSSGSRCSGCATWSCVAAGDDHPRRARADPRSTTPLRDALSEMLARADASSARRCVDARRAASSACSRSSCYRSSPRSAEA